MLQHLVQFDVMEKLGVSLINQGWYIDEHSKKLSCKGRTGISHFKKWIFVSPDPDRKCSLYQVIVDQCGFIPTKCMDCWKVVVKPRTLHELMELLKLQHKFTEGVVGTDRFCKCGIEERTYVPQNYGGYFYTNSKEAGLSRYREVRPLVDVINPTIPVTLKRYCTEFEMNLGPSDKYQRPDWADGFEALISRVIDLDGMGVNSTQPDYLIGHNIRKWIEFAWDRSDPTVTMYNQNQPLYTPSVTYHQELIEEESA